MVDCPAEDVTFFIKDPQNPNAVTQKPVEVKCTRFDWMFLMCPVFLVGEIRVHVDPSKEQSITKFVNEIV